MPLTAGSRLGPYEIHAAIGAGGMGEVFRARDTRLGRTVAIKVLSPGLMLNPSARQRFEREARAVATLSHPNICSVFDVGQHEGIEFLVMEYLEGETLATRLTRGPLPIREALQHGIALTQALAAAHEAGLIHRDVKPANIMLTKGGAKLLDFGLAKGRSDSDPAADTELRRDTLTQTGTVLGTLQYMAPEQLEGREADQRSDLFGVGGVLYEMFSGRRPFAADTDAAAIGKILHAVPDDPLDDPSPTATALNRIVHRCLEKDPADRFQSAKDLGFVLDASARGLVTESHHLPVPARARWHIPVVTVAALIALPASFLIGRWFAPAREPMSFQQVTWRHGSVLAGRFAPDGQAVIYGAAWEGSPREVFIHHPGSPESRPLGILNAELLAISSKGELAVGERLDYSNSLVPSASTLARVSLSGGAPRAVLDGVTSADWSPDGTSLAVARRTPSGMTLEYPIGAPLYQTTGWIGYIKVSRDGRMVAFIDFPERQRSGRISVVDRTGTVTHLTQDLFRPRGLAWSHNTEEVWFTFQDAAGGSPIQAVARDGTSRVVERLPGWAVLHDIAPDGTILVSKERIRVRAFVKTRALSSEREISWLDGTNIRDISADGRFVLLTEAAAGGGPGFSTYIRGVDGSPAARLGEGWGLALSRAQPVALIYSILKERLFAVPTGPGEIRELPKGPIQSYTAGVQDSGWLPDGRLVFDAQAASDRVRLYVQDINGGDPQPTKVETNGAGWALSPDGRSVVIETPQGPQVVALESGVPTPMPQARNSDRVAAWNRDGIFLIASSDRSHAVIDRVDALSGKRNAWRTLTNPEKVGIEQPFGASPVIADADTFGFGLLQVLSELVVVHGLK